MRLLVISGAPIIPSTKGWMAYAPYVKEMEIWASYSDEVQFCCPIWKDTNGLLVQNIDFPTIDPVVLDDFNITTKRNTLKAFFVVFKNVFLISKAMQQADHIHLRCPANMGLLGCIVQLAFPSKPKTAKYAGNWDSKSKQPWTYRLQKWILDNTFLTRNMQVLIYGQWEGSSQNIKPFFTATYRETDKLPLRSMDLKNKINFLFVGALFKGKNPLYAVQLVAGLHKKGHDVNLCIYGDGKQRSDLETYIRENNLAEIVFLKGNQTQDMVKEAYQNSHFVLLPSESEGWPKVIAEGMFWGCVPVATSVSCVPYMLDHGKRGVLLEMNLEKDIKGLEAALNDESDFIGKRKLASDWSRDYTLDVFESEIKKIIQI